MNACFCRLLGWASLASSAWGQIVINEIHHSPDPRPERVEFIELYNANTHPVSLAGWRLFGGVDFTFTNGPTLPAGGYLVVGEDPAALTRKYGVTPVLGPWQGGLGGKGDRLRLYDASNGLIDEVNYALGFPWPTVGDPPGNSIELLNPSFDNSLGGNWRPSVLASVGHGPTPGRQNNVFTTHTAPALRQVEHTPHQPRADEPVLITVKATDPEGVIEVALEYQIVEPGNYISLDDPAYRQGWTRTLMTSSTNNLYQATLPADVQKHRRLIRYRLTAIDSLGATVQAPLPDDSTPNFAYFVYNGVPAWTGAVRPGATTAPGQAFTVAAEEMNRVPTFQLLSQKKKVLEATGWSPGSALNQYRGDDYLWKGALVYDGEVYDHIRYRTRGGVWRYTMGKNAWKFDFNRGHELRMRDNYHHRFQVPWDKLSFRPDIQQGDYGHRGEQGLFESVGYRLLQLAGNAANNSVHIQFRVIDAAEEAPVGKQYDGDFWGLYLAVEEQDGTWLKERGLPDGNIYDMEGSFGNPNHQGRDGPTDSSDLRTFLNAYSGNNSLRLTEAWWRTNLDLRGYFGYQIIVQGIHHYDIQDGKNYFYYRNPISGQWSVQAWDLDLTWADSMYRGGKQSGFEPFLTPILNGFKWSNPRLPNLQREFRNRVREVRDLLFNPDQAWQVIDEQALLIRGTNSPSFIDADRAQWDYNPIMKNSAITDSGKAGVGRFYQIGHGSKTFEGMVQLMKDYVTYRATDTGYSLTTIATEVNIPATPTLTYIGPAGFPENQLEFSASAFVGTGNFGSVQYRVGEITRTNHPGFEPGKPWHYEIESAWESQVFLVPTAFIHVPAGALRAGQLHRARVRYLDATGRASHWSEPIEFTTGQPNTGPALLADLELTEIQYDPAPGGYEYLELHNRSLHDPLVLDGATFTAGIDYTFPTGTTLAPDAYVVLARSSDLDGLRGFHSLPMIVTVLGPYYGSLANDTDTITLRTAPGGAIVFSIGYRSTSPWPFPVGGTGRSLVPNSGSPPNSSLPTNWRGSTLPNGSPGRPEPDSEKTLSLRNPHSAEGHFTVDLAAAAGQTSTLEVSADLKSWTMIATNTGPTQINQSLENSQRYFRAVAR